MPPTESDDHHLTSEKGPSPQLQQRAGCLKHLLNKDEDSTDGIECTDEESDDGPVIPMGRTVRAPLAARERALSRRTAAAPASIHASRERQSSPIHGYRSKGKAVLHSPAKLSTSCEHGTRMALPSKDYLRGRRILIPTPDLPLVVVTMRGDLHHVDQQSRYARIASLRRGDAQRRNFRYLISRLSLPGRDNRHVEDACIVGGTVVLGYSDQHRISRQISLLPLQEFVNAPVSGSLSTALSFNSKAIRITIPEAHCTLICSTVGTGVCLGKRILITLVFAASHPCLSLMMGGFNFYPEAMTEKSWYGPLPRSKQGTKLQVFR